MDPWSIPPTEDEVKAASVDPWSAPPTEAEMAASAPKPEGPSDLESGLRGVAQGGTLGFADEIAGGAEALWDMLKGQDTPFAEAYRKHRDESRANFDAAKEANPAAFIAGNVAGGIGTGVLAAPLTGGTSLGSAIAMGAGQGALNAVGNADEVDEQAVVDALQQGALGGAFGAAGHGIGQLVGKGANAANEVVTPALASKLDDVALASANRAIRSGSTAGRFDLDEGQLRRALEEGIVDYGDTVGDIAGKANAARQQAGEYVEAVSNAFQDEGVNPKIEALAKAWRDRADEIERTTLGSPLPKLFRERADELMTKGEDVFVAGPTATPAGDFERRAKLLDLINMKREAQNAANFEQNAPKALEQGRRELSSDLRNLIEENVTDAATRNDLVHPGDDLKTLAQNFLDANKRDSDLIGISNAARHGAKLDKNRSEAGITAKMVGLGSLATGHPLGLVAAGAKHLFDKRGASTVAKAAFDLSKSLGKIGGIAIADPAKLGKYGSVLSAAAQRGADALNSAIFVLGNSDPEFQKMAAELDGGEP